jgi:steroid delta-isomerase-like uncharacterized protein
MRALDMPMNGFARSVLLTAGRRPYTRKGMEMLKRCSMFALMLLLVVGVWGSVWSLTPEEMKATQVAMEELFNAHDVEAWLSYLTDDAVHDYVPAQPPISGKEEMRQFMTAVFEAFPDGQSTTQRVLAFGDILVGEWAFTGTLEGQWLGMGPTGQGGTPVPHLTIFEFEGDKIKRLTTYFDVVTFMVVSGLMPPPDALPPLEPSFEVPAPEATGLDPLDAEAETLSRFNTYDLAQWAKMIRPDADLFDNAFGIPLDRDQFVAVNEIYILAFPDSQVEAVRMVDMGDGWVLVEAVFRGTHDGPYMDIPATGNPMTNRLVWIRRYDADGLATYHHTYVDSFTALVQMGIVELPTTSVLPTTWGQVKSLFQE